MNIARLDPEAELELKEAAAYYAVHSKPASRRFLKAVLDLSRVIARAPQRFPRLAGMGVEVPVRRALVPGFPFALVFVALETHVQIIAVAHTRREPGYWLHRIEEE